MSCFSVHRVMTRCPAVGRLCVRLFHDMVGVTVAMIHPHVFHGSKRTRTALRNFSLHPRSRGERSTSIPTPIHGFGKDRVGKVFVRFDDGVIGFGGTDTKLL